MMDLKMEVYSPFLELLGLLEIQNSVVWENKAFSAGSFTLNSLITEESKTLLVPENIIWIAGDDAGIIEYVQQETGENGPYITVKGCNLTGLLARRILWGRYDLSGPVPEIMYWLVDDCCINPTRGETEARKIPGLVLAGAAPTGGPSIRVQKTGGYLLDALEELGTAYGVPFGVRFNPAVPCMEFWARYGVNRSIHQNNVEPVFYSTELDDVLSSEYSYNAQNYRNVALVAGEGEGNDRVMVIVNGDVEPAPEPPTPPTTYTISLSVDPEGGGLASGGGTFNEGQSVTVIATVSSGYTFSGWRENEAIVSTSPSYTFTATADRALTAVFAIIVPTYTVSATIDPAGSGTVTGVGQYQQGAQATLYATAADGYELTGWSENGTTVSTDMEYTFTVTGDRQLVAVFAVYKPSRLPDGYTEVAYISNPNLGYADNIPNLTEPLIGTRIELNVRISSAFSKSYIWGRSYTSRTMRRGSFLYLADESTIRLNLAQGVNENYNYDIVFQDNNLNIIIDSPKGIFSVNDVEKNIINLSGTMGAGYMPELFAIRFCNTTSNANSFGYKPSNFDFISMKVYNSTASETGELLFDYAPCISPSGDVGIYEIVHGVFTKSAYDTKPFAAGPAV